MTFDFDPAELHRFPDRLFRRELQVPANLRELIEDLDGQLAARLDFERVQLWKREHIFEDWRHFERDRLVEAALEYQPDANSQEEVHNMSTTLGQTLEEWAEQRGIERGMERGIERGIERGRLEASHQLLRCLLEDRFGPLPDDLRRQIEETRDLARLERSIRRCPNLSSLEELEL